MKRLLTISTAILLAGGPISLWAADTVSAADKKFVMEAAGGGMAEVKLGELAKDKGSSDFVKQFGQKMIDDHSKANDDLKSVAQKLNITLPSDMPAKEKALYGRLSKLSGAGFDSAYIRAMTTDHKMDVAEFKKESTMAKNADVKDFATRTLPTLEEHLKMIESKKMM